MNKNKLICIAIYCLTLVVTQPAYSAEQKTAAGKKNKAQLALLQAKLASLESKYAALASALTKLQTTSTTGQQGPKGDTGPAGPQGPAGEQGPQGESGAALSDHCVLTTIVSDIFGENDSPSIEYYVPDADIDYIVTYAASVYRTKVVDGQTVINYNKAEDAYVTEAYLIPSSDGSRVDGIRVTMNPVSNGVHKTMMAMDVYICSKPF